MLNKIFSENQVLKNSILSKEPSLVYQFGKIYPVSINFEKFILGFILEIPVPVEEEIKPFFSVTNVGWNNVSSELKLKLPLPENAVRKFGGIFQSIDMKHCQNKPGLSYCDLHAFAQNPASDCLRLVVAGTDTVPPGVKNNCHEAIQISQLKNETVFGSNFAGLLIRTTEKFLTISNIPSVSHISIGHKMGLPENGVLWVPHSNYTHLIVGQHIITSMLNKVQLSMPAPTGTEPFSPPRLHLKPISWTELEVAQNSNLEAQHMISEQISKLTNLKIPTELIFPTLFALFAFFLGFVTLCTLAVFVAESIKFAKFWTSTIELSVPTLLPAKIKIFFTGKCFRKKFRWLRLYSLKSAQNQ